MHNHTIITTAIAALLFASASNGWAQKAMNPCNPCGGKAMNPCNPCGGKPANPCNPCGGKAGMTKAMAVNPCFAKKGTVFYVNDPMHRDTVTIKSEALLEDIVGTSSSLSGYLVFDPANPKGGVRGTMQIPVSSLNTGIPLRDEHMRSAAWLDAEGHPLISLTVTDARRIRTIRSSTDYATYDMNLLGQFSLHGETREVEVPARLTYLQESKQTQSKMPGNLLAIRSDFSVRLADYKITGGSMGSVIGSKLSDTINVDVSLIGSDEKPCAGASSPCNPCGGKAMDPCNPCAGKAANPCNPCGGKAMNPCNPCAG